MPGEAAGFEAVARLAGSGHRCHLGRAPGTQRADWVTGLAFSTGDGFERRRSGRLG